MKKLNIISTMLLIMISMSIHAQGNFKVNPNGEKDLAVVKEYEQAIYSRDSKKIENIHASDVVGYGPRWDSPRNRDQIVQAFKNIWEFASDLRYDRPRMLAVTVSGDEIPEYNGNWVMVWAVYVVKEKTSGKEIQLDVHEALKIDKGKIIGKLTYYNELDQMIQMGLYPGN